MVDFLHNFCFLVAFIMVGAIDHQNHADSSQYAHLQSCRLNNICWEQRGIHSYLKENGSISADGKNLLYADFYVHCLCIDNR
jgi:hypothetical protein